MYRFLTCVLLTATGCIFLGSSTKLENYEVYKQLELALTHGSSNSIPNTQLLADVFFPKQSLEPLCIRIRYNLLCNSTNRSVYEQPIAGSCFATNFSADTDDQMTDITIFLWTEYHLTFPIGTMLHAFYKSGIGLRGFYWQNSCNFESETKITLPLSSLNYSRETVQNALNDLTSQLKVYAVAAGDKPKVGSSFRGYSLNWNTAEGDYHLINVIYITYIIILNIFIFFFSLASSNLLYTEIYKIIEGKKDPGYALFWASVVLSLIWNCGPAGLALHRINFKICLSFGIMILLQLFVAMAVKKKNTFPIPGLKTTGCLMHHNDTHTFNRAVLTCARCTINHTIQVISIWSLLVFFTVVMHYATSVILSIYLDPVNSLVKLVFIKTAALSLLISVALLFTLDHFTCSLSVSAMKENAKSCVSVLTIVSTLPIQAFLIFIIGGIIFNANPLGGNWKSIFTVIPSGILVFASWFSRGLLFPQKETILTDDDYPEGDKKVENRKATNVTTHLMQRHDESTKFNDYASTKLRSKSST